MEKRFKITAEASTAFQKYVVEIDGLTAEEFKAHNTANVEMTVGSLAHMAVEGAKSLANAVPQQASKPAFQPKSGGYNGGGRGGNRGGGGYGSKPVRPSAKQISSLQSTKLQHIPLGELTQAIESHNFTNWDDVTALMDWNFGKSANNLSTFQPPIPGANQQTQQAPQHDFTNVEPPIDPNATGDDLPW